MEELLQNLFGYRYRAKKFSLPFAPLWVAAGWLVLLALASGLDAAFGYDLPAPVSEPAAEQAPVLVFEKPQFTDENPADFGGNRAWALQAAEEPALLPVGFVPPESTGPTLQQVIDDYNERHQAQEASGGAALPAGSFNAENIGLPGLGSYSYYKGINPDTIGWLRVPGTNINYPVVQGGADNNYYLYRDIYGNYSKQGVIWADVRVGTNSNNTVIYGHNWGNVFSPPRVGAAGDIMFAQLPAYHYRWFAQSYPYIHYSDAASNKTWKVFAVFYTDVSFDYINVNASGGTLQNIIDVARRRSLHNFDVQVDSSDRILTLSTCSWVYGSDGNQRFVVMARLLRPGEGIEAVTVS